MAAKHRGIRSGRHEAHRQVPHPDPGQRRVVDTRSTAADPWQAMHKLGCSGDLLSRIVRPAHRADASALLWGEAPECASGVDNNRGQ
jgi:hypothetical protein